MSKSREVSFEDMKNYIGVDEFELVTSYVLEYFNITSSIYNDNDVDLKIILSSKTYYVMEASYNYVLVTIKETKDGFLILPIGIARYLSDIILERENALYDDSTIYYSLLNGYGEYSSVESFLFFMSVILVDLFNFDKTKAKLKIGNSSNVYISGSKSEFYQLDKTEIYFSHVWYNLSLYPDKKVVKVFKTYGNDIRKDDKFELNFTDIIETALNELRTSEA